MAAAFFISARLAMRQARRKSIPVDIVSGVCFAAIVFGIIGARLFFVSYNLGFYLGHPLEIFMLQHGGLSWFGGLFLGVIAAITYLKIRRFSVYEALDLLAPFIALAQAIGRIGCLFNGCCYGKPSKYGIFFETHHAQLIPTQIYSSLMLVLIFVFLRLIQERPANRPGEIFYLYLLLYSIQRFMIEFWRADNPQFLWGLTLFQALCIALFILSSIKLLMLRRD